jgi:hypothetical protein
MTQASKQPIRDRISSFIQGPTSSGILGALGHSLSSGAAQTVAAANLPHNPAMQRMSGPALGGINTVSASTAMPGPAGAVPVMGQGSPLADDLQAGYLHLNQPGSPLGPMGMLAANSTRRAQIVQDAIMANEQQMMSGMMIPRGNLPMTQADQMAQQAAMYRRG